MVKILEQALAEVATLPEAAQEDIGRQLLAHVEKLRRLRADIDEGIRSLDAGEGRNIDMAEFKARMKKKYAGKQT
ncbi:MAG: hypothetical protein AB7K64_21490 [Variibacter sp.]